MARLGALLLIAPLLLGGSLRKGDTGADAAAIAKPSACGAECTHGVDYSGLDDAWNRTNNEGNANRWIYAASPEKGMFLLHHGHDGAGSCGMNEFQEWSDYPGFAGVDFQKRGTWEHGTTNYDRVALAPSFTVNLSQGVSDYVGAVDIVLCGPYERVDKVPLPYIAPWPIIEYPVQLGEVVVQISNGGGTLQWVRYGDSSSGRCNSGAGCASCCKNFGSACNAAFGQGYQCEVSQGWAPIYPSTGSGDVSDYGIAGTKNWNTVRLDYGNIVEPIRNSLCTSIQGNTCFNGLHYYWQKRERGGRDQTGLEPWNGLLLGHQPSHGAAQVHGASLSDVRVGCPHSIDSPTNPIGCTNLGAAGDGTGWTTFDTDMPGSTGQIGTSGSKYFVQRGGVWYLAGTGGNQMGELSAFRAWFHAFWVTRGPAVSQ